VEWPDIKWLSGLLISGGTVVWGFLQRQRIGSAVGRFLEPRKNLIYCETEKRYLADTLARIIAIAGNLEDSPYSHLINSVQKSKNSSDEGTSSQTSWSGSGVPSPPTVTELRTKLSHPLRRKGEPDYSPPRSDTEFVSDIFPEER
jgi:hypothetical protein